MKYGKVAHARLVWNEPDEHWEVIIEGRRLSHVLNGEFPTVGDALNKAEQWAKDRGLKLAIEGIPLHILRMPPSNLMHENSPSGRNYGGNR